MDLPQIPGYRLLEKVGEGAKRDVYRARAKKISWIPEDSYDFTIKLYKGTEKNPEFLGELEAARRLNQLDHLERLWDYGEFQGRAYTVTEFIEGRSIINKVFQEGKCIRRQLSRTLTLDEILDIVIKVGKGIQYLHSQGYVARDLTLSNIMINDDLSIVKICDLGSIRKIGSKIEPTFVPGEMEPRLWPRGYLHPDIIKGKGGTLSEETDVYSLMCCLYYMLQGGEKCLGDGEALDFFDDLTMFSSPLIKDANQSTFNRAILMDGFHGHLEGFLDNIEIFRLAEPLTGKNVLVKLNHPSDHIYAYGKLKGVSLHGIGVSYLFDSIVILEMVGQRFDEAEAMDAQRVARMPAFLHHIDRNSEKGRGFIHDLYGSKQYIDSTNISMIKEFEINPQKEVYVGEIDEYPDFFVLDDVGLKEYPKSDDPDIFYTPEMHMCEKIIKSFTGSERHAEKYRSRVDAALDVSKWVRINELLEGSSEESG